MSVLRITAAIVLGLLVAVAMTNPAIAGKKKKYKKSSYSYTPRVSYEERSTYAIPFTCGRNEERPASTVRGDFATAISVTNLNDSETRIRARLQLTEPEPARSDRIRRSIAAGRSFLLDCEAILDRAFITPVPLSADGFFQGVLTVDSLDSLSVVVQSSASGPEGGISVDNRQVVPQVMKIRKEKDDDRDEKEICHIPPGNPDNRHTIEVGDAAVNAHLSHGDHLGECDDD